DPSSTFCWKGGVACLGSTFDRDGLTRFFLAKYKPTPILVPWSGGDFFAVNQQGSPGPFAETPTGAAIIEAFLATTTERLAEYRDALTIVFRVMRETGVLTK